MKIKRLTATAVLLVLVSGCSVTRTPESLQETNPSQAAGPCALSTLQKRADRFLADTQTCVESLAISYRQTAVKIDAETVTSDLAVIGLLSLTTGAELFGAHRDVSKGLGLIGASLGATKTYLSPANAANELYKGADRLQCAIGKVAELQVEFTRYQSQYDSMSTAYDSADASVDKLTDPRSKALLANAMATMYDACEGTFAYSLLKEEQGKHVADEPEIARRLYAVAAEISFDTLQAFRGTRAADSGLEARFTALLDKFKAAQSDAASMTSAAQGGQSASEATLEAAAEAKSTKAAPGSPSAGQIAANELAAAEVKNAAEKVEGMAETAANIRVQVAGLEACVGAN